MNLRIDEKQKVEHVAIILDQSGSMESIKVPTLTGVNEQIQTLRKNSDGIQTFVTLTKFSDTVDITYFDRNINDVQELTKDDYIPGGITAMLDAVGLTINRMKNDINEGIDDVSYLLVIVSDGMENASKEYTWQQVKDLIKQCELDNKWTITYMGANQDLWEVSNDLGINSNNITLFRTNSEDAAAKGFITSTQGLMNYRMARMSNTAEGLEKAAFYSSVGASINDSTDTTEDNN